MSFGIYCNKSEQESKLSPLNHVTSLWNQQLPLFVALMQGLEKKVYYVDWHGHLHEFFFSCFPSNNQGSRKVNLLQNH